MTSELMAGHRSSADTIRELQADPRIRARCPDCGEEFSLRRAVLFHVGGRLPDAFRVAIYERRQRLRDGHAELREARARVRKSEQLSLDINVASVLERVVPTLEGFGLHQRDCRALFEPIDYIVFNGLARSGQVESLTFIDVKVGGAHLNGHQRMIRDAINGGRVSFKLYDAAGRSQHE